MNLLCPVSCNSVFLVLKTLLSYLHVTSNPLFHLCELDYLNMSQVTRIYILRISFYTINRPKGKTHRTQEVYVKKHLFSLTVVLDQSKHETDRMEPSFCLLFPEFQVLTFLTDKPGESQNNFFFKLGRQQPNRETSAFDTMPPRCHRAAAAGSSF